MSKKVRLAAAVLAFLLVAGGAAFYLKSRQAKPAESSEIAQIKATQDIKRQTELYRQLLERVGPVEAQEQLFRSGLPFTGQTHLINHEAGNYIYQKFGNEGLSYCRTYFLESCYHGFLLNIIGDGGKASTDDIKEVMQSCTKAGPSVPSQCGHAIGHGYVATIGYKNLSQALDKCDEVAAQVDGFPLYNCHDGAFMENVWAVHTGAPSPDRWVKDGDDLYPCNAPEVKPHQVRACWSNQPSLLFQRYGKISKVAEVCGTLKDAANKETCYDGLARQVHPLTNGSADATFQLCGEMGVMADSCVLTIVQAGFSVGDRNTPFELCKRITAGQREECNSRLLAMMRTYVPEAKQRAALCDKFAEPWRQRCKVAG